MAFFSEPVFPPLFLAVPRLFWPLLGYPWADVVLRLVTPPGKMPRHALSTFMRFLNSRLCSLQVGWIISIFRRPFIC